MSQLANTTEYSGSILRPEPHFPSIGPEIVFNIGSFPIASTTLMLVLSFALVVVICFVLRRKIATLPDSFQNICEYAYESIEGLLIQLTGDERRSRLIIPTLGSIIVFILLSNMMGHLPLLTSIKYNGQYMFRSATSDFNTTLALAVGAVSAIQFIGFRQNGLGYLGHFFKFKGLYLGMRQGIGAFMMAVVEFFVGLLEFIGEFIRIISLSVRLFGNMFAGKVVMAIAIGSFAYVLPAIWLGFEFLVALVQAIVFTSLVTVYYTMVLKKEDGH